MGLNITYGEGGFCENCDESHDHLLHNIISQKEISDEQDNARQNARQSAMDKLRALGLTDGEIQALLG
jgi:hypothetical protein